jgi:CBS domain-containing protein
MTMSGNPLSKVLSAHRVLGLLAPESRQMLVQVATGLTLQPGQVAITQGELAGQLLLILQGQLELQDLDLGHTLTFHTGEWLGAGITPIALQASCQVVASAPTQAVSWPRPVLAQLLRERPELLAFFPAPLTPDENPGQAPHQQAGPGTPTNLLNMPLRTLLRRQAITLPPAATIRDAAKLMREQRVSSVMLVEQDHLFGLVTDRDLRNRAIAENLDMDRAVADIATLAPLTADLRRPAFEALLLMTRHNIHHVPVMDGNRIAGMITATDLNEQHSTSAVYLAGDIFKQTTVEGLAQISQKIKALQRNLAAAHASAYSTGHIVTTITDALTSQLIHLAEAKLGPAPVDYVWVAAGSQARCEQTAQSDQDNGLILDNRYDESQHGEYFRELSVFVCDGLDACGFIHCPGEIMAMTDSWRQPQRRWAQYFRQWVEEPDPKALMLTSVFFDLRAVHGKTGLLDSLRQEVLQKTLGNSLFLAHMVGNVLKFRPPLGLFGQITPLRSGEHAGTVDLKHNGIAVIVSLARIYALAGGLAAVNTDDRLELAGQTAEVSPQGARDLRDALEFLGQLRISHQSRQVALGQQPNNYLALREISNFERSQLKNAFAVVNALQDVLDQRYHGGRF